MGSVDLPLPWVLGACIPFPPATLDSLDGFSCWVFWVRSACLLALQVSAISFLYTAPAYLITACHTPTLHCGTLLPGHYLALSRLLPRCLGGYT